MIDMACFGTCLDYVRELKDGRKLGMTDEQIETKYNREWEHLIKKQKEERIKTGMII